MTNTAAPGTALLKVLPIGDVRAAAPTPIDEGDPATDPIPLPADLLGRWELTDETMIGDTWTSRRSDPAGWNAVTFGADGSALFEYANGIVESYDLSYDGERDLLTFAWESRFDVLQSDSESMALLGDHRGR
ncbi:MAG: hypothetical protein AAGB93_04805, partial [Planctomycetota bacterium]